MRPTDSRKGGVVAGVLTVLLSLVLLAVIGAVLCGWYIARNVRVEETRTGHGKTVKIETPVGSLHVQERRSADARELGVPAYPGARLSERDGKLVDLDFDFGNGRKQVGIRAADFITDDNVDKVLAYYRKELPHWIVANKRHGFEMKYSEDGFKRFIHIREENGHTRIGIAQVAEDETN